MKLNNIFIFLIALLISGLVSLAMVYQLISEIARLDPMTIQNYIKEIKAICTNVNISAEIRSQACADKKMVEQFSKSDDGLDVIYKIHTSLIHFNGLTIYRRANFGRGQAPAFDNFLISYKRNDDEGFYETDTYVGKVSLTGGNWNHGYSLGLNPRIIMSEDAKTIAFYFAAKDLENRSNQLFFLHKENLQLSEVDLSPIYAEYPNAMIDSIDLEYAKLLLVQDMKNASDSQLVTIAIPENKIPVKLDTNYD